MFRVLTVYTIDLSGLSRPLPTVVRAHFYSTPYIDGSYQTYQRRRLSPSHLCVTLSPARVNCVTVGTGYCRVCVDVVDPKSYNHLGLRSLNASISMLIDTLLSMQFLCRFAFLLKLLGASTLVIITALMSSALQSANSTPLRVTRSRASVMHGVNILRPLQRDRGFKKV